MADRFIEKAAILALASVLLTACDRDRSERGSEAAWKDRARDCQQIADLFDRTECYTDLAIEESDASICGDATHEGVRYQCYAIYAERQNDLEACEAIPTDSDEASVLHGACISDVAAIRSDAQLCARVEPESIRDGCYLKIAEATADRELCEKIVDRGLRSLCSGDTVWVQ